MRKVFNGLNFEDLGHIVSNMREVRNTEGTSNQPTMFCNVNDFGSLIE